MTTVTLPVEELAALVKHANGLSAAPYRVWFNLSRRDPERYHRCLTVDLSEQPSGEVEVRFTLQEDGREVQTVTHNLTNLFEVLPQMAAFLAARQV